MTTTTTPDFTIRNLAVIDGKENQIGNRLLATFAMSVSGVHINGCLLILKPDGTVMAKGPTGKNYHKLAIGATFTDPDLEQAAAARAGEIYALFTGRAPGEA